MDGPPRDDRAGDRTYDRVADLPVRVDGWSLEPHERETSSGFTRKTTVFALEGDGHVGRGEDVTYTPEAHDALVESPPERPLDGEYALDEAADALDGVDLFPAGAPERAVFRNYRRWGVESALFDLALRQAGTDLAGVLDREPAPVRFVVSTSLGEPPSAGPVEAWLDVDPSLEFKVDATDPWPDAVVDALVATGRVRTIDLKAHYGDDDGDDGEGGDGTDGEEMDGEGDDGSDGKNEDTDDEAWQGRPDPAFYRRLLEAFPDAVVEDPGVTDATRPALEAAADRLSWDAPVHSVADFEVLPLSPSWCNVKPSRFGTLARLLDFVDFARAAGVSLYGGGQFELSVGRGQLHALASVFHPDGPNDVAPRGYNDPEPRAGLPSSPLSPPESTPGFGWDGA